MKGHVGDVPVTGRHHLLDSGRSLKPRNLLLGASARMRMALETLFQILGKIRRHARAPKAISCTGHPLHLPPLTCGSSRATSGARCFSRKLRVFVGFELGVARGIAGLHGPRKPLGREEMLLTRRYLPCSSPPHG